MRETSVPYNLICLVNSTGANGHARVLTPDARDISIHLFILTRSVIGYYIVYTLDIRIFFHLSEGEIQWVGPAGRGFRIGANSAKWERSHISFTGRPTTNPLL